MAHHRHVGAYQNNYNRSHRTLLMQWLYKAYERVDAYPKALPKLMNRTDASGGQRCRGGSSSLEICA